MGHSALAFSSVMMRASQAWVITATILGWCFSVQKTYRPEIFLVSLAAIVLEISLTRIFSFKLYYYFTYLILGIAMLGLGAGGVFVAVFARLRERDPTRLISQCCLAASLLIPAVYVLVARVQISVSTLTSDPWELAKLFLICASLFIPFSVVGVILATIFGNRPDDMNKLYFSDLAGAALGCVLVIPLFLSITPGSSMLAMTRSRPPHRRPAAPRARPCPSRSTRARPPPSGVSLTTREFMRLAFILLPSPYRH